MRHSPRDQTYRYGVYGLSSLLDLSLEFMEGGSQGGTGGVRIWGSHSALLEMGLRIRRKQAHLRRS